MTAANAQTLAELKPKQSAIITGFSDNSTGYKQSLLAMGLTPGTTIRMIRFAPLGDPIQIEVRGTQLALRRIEAKALIVQTADSKI